MAASSAAPAFNPLSSIDPSSQLELMTIQRQRDLAAEMQKQSMTADPGQMIAGHFVGGGMLGGVARLGSAGVGRLGSLPAARLTAGLVGRESVFEFGANETILKIK